MNNRVCMVVYSYYPRDPRVRKEATALARNGYDVTVICLRNTGEAKEETVGGVKVRRLPFRTERSGGKLRYAYQYIVFFAMAACAVSTAHIRRRFGVVHAHSLPDFIVFTAAFPKLTGAKVVLDLHEAMPEIYLSKMGAKNSAGPLFRLMVAQEKISMAFADRVITVSDLIGDIFVERGLPREKLTIIWNTPDYEKPMPPVSGGGKRLVYAGSMNEFQDFDTVIDGLAELKDVELDIFGEGTQAEPLGRKIAEKGLKNVHLKGWVDPDKLKGMLSTYAGAILPSGGSDVARIALGNKVLEYSLLGLPVLATDHPGIRAVFDDSCFFFYKVGDPADFVRGARSLLSDDACARRKVLTSQEVIDKKGLTWSRVEGRLVGMYRELGRN
jgi:glycosyltransferase involved in cell wall biosynthesis